MNKFLLDIYMGVPKLTDFWLIVVISLVTTLFALAMSLNSLHILQLSGYRLRGYTDWCKQTKFADFGRLLMVSLLSSGAMLITNVLLDEVLVGRALKYVSIIFFFIFCFVYVVNLSSIQRKQPIKYTARMTRLIAMIAFLCFGSSIGLMYLSVNCIKYFTAGGVLVIPILLPVIIVVAHFVMIPVEKLIAKKYIKKAKAKLAAHKNLTIIGVTGSYGKTTVKNIIAGLLAEKYRVCVSPFSYNTPLGLCKTILETLTDDDEILVAEMGARNVGDIKELCDMVNPTIGVVTGIGNQHLMTFGTVEKLIATKSELVRHIEANNGFVVVNTESDGAKQIFDEATCEKLSVNINQKEGVYADEIVATSTGSKFKLVVDGKALEANTALLGEHNISNILVGVTVAKKLGLSNGQIIDGIGKLTPTSHRLAIVPSNNALIVIDDAYNGSVEGSKSALNVLSKFEGKKVVITPGLVELGEEQFNCNFEFGRDMSKVCDYVIVTGISNWEAIYSGLKFAGFNTDKILRAGSLNQAVTMLATITNPGDVVLFENDLPDNYL
ncbi:MAG: UDP-N-acetylmuramoyl-tripeptide--D-alanyl-D-alanine ligase [Clostridia bacterium]|nr:UDP-N-acetylmuramoyl-tripeptide--D-alanyl-D-alanine ligase [Clostridia bacterium]